MKDFYNLAKTLIHKDKIQKVINRKTETIQLAFEESASHPEKIISLGWHCSLPEFAKQGLDVSYVSDNPAVIEFAEALCKAYGVTITNHNMPLETFCVKFQLDEEITEYDCVLALDQYYTFADSEDEQRMMLQNSLSLLHDNGVLMTSLMDYKNIKFSSKVFSEPFYVRNDDNEYIIIANRKWNTEERKRWKHYEYAINQTTKELHAFGPTDRQAMFFKQLAYHTASLGWNNFIVHKKLIYKPMFSSETQYIISITK